MRKRIVLVGGGSAGFYTAASIAGNKLADFDVTVVHSPEIGVIGVGESTTAAVPYQLHRTGMSMIDFFQKVEPVFKLGIKFTFAPAGAPWKEFDYPFEGAYSPVDHLRHDPGYYMLLEKQKICKSLNTHLMDLGKGPMSFDNRFNFFGFHFRNDRLIEYLKNYSISKGAEVLEGKVVSCSKDERGYLTSVSLSDGRIIQGDIFIDNTGFASLLLEKQMEEKWIPQPLMCDRAVTGSWMRSPSQIKPYTMCEAMDSGWMWQIDHTTETNRGYVYSSAFITDEAAEKEYRMKTNNLPGDTRVVKFKSGYRNQAWVKNVIGLGNSYAFVEPLESTGLHIMCQSARELLKNLTHHAHDLDNQSLRDRYNATVKEIWTETFDFITLHYKMCKTYNTPFWQANRNDLVLGETSQRVIEHYKHIGPSVTVAPKFPEGNIFGAQGYYSILMGLGVETQCKNPVDSAEFNRWLEAQRQLYHLAKSNMSSAEATHKSKFVELF